MYQLYLYIRNTNIRRRLVPGELVQGHRKESDSLMVVLRLDLENQRLFVMDTVAVVVVAAASTAVAVDIVETAEAKHTNLLLAQPRLYQMTCQRNISSKNIEKILEKEKREKCFIS